MDSGGASGGLMVVVRVVRQRGRGVEMVIGACGLAWAKA